MAFSGKDASAAVRRNLRDRDFVASLLGELPGVDAGDPRIACVLAACTADPKPVTANTALGVPPPVGGRISNGGNSNSSPGKEVAGVGGVGGMSALEVGGAGDRGGDGAPLTPPPPPSGAPAMAMGSPAVGSALAAARTVGRRPERRSVRASMP